MTPYPIDPATAKSAAQDYITIKRAGLLDELRREISDAIQAHAQLPISHGPMGAPMREWSAYHARRAEINGPHVRFEIDHANETAADLADMLGCPPGAVEPFIVPACITEPLRRTIVLDCLRNMANYIRRKPTARRTA
jgi:hypothetical protein